MKKIFFFLLLIMLSARARSCTIVYSYDNAGNRIKRTWACDTGNNNNNNNNSYRTTNNSATAPIDSANIENTCSLYPNPSTGYFKLVMQYAVDADIYVMDIKGMIVEKKKLAGTETDFNISQYASGTYTLHLVSPSGYQFSVKIIKE
jgi:Secretion system C-terminal sorting domain